MDERLIDHGAAGAIRIASVTVGMLAENCYILAPVTGGDAVIVDPGAESEVILGAVRAWGLTPRLVVNTHGHADHIGANGAVAAAGAELAIHAADAPMLTDPSQNLSLFIPPALVSPPATRFLTDGEEVVVGAVRLGVIHTPGHTEGGLTFALDGFLLAGDTLFAGSVGRVDLPGGSWESLMGSIVERLFPLGDAVRVLPGHGPETTIGAERRANPFVRQWLAGGEAR